MGYHDDMTKELGLKIIGTSKMLNDLVDELQHRADDKDIEYNDGDGTICCDPDEGYFSAILRVLALCAKFPGRTTWVVAETEIYGYLTCHLFAEDSVRAAAARVRNEIKRVKRAPRPKQEK